MLFLKHGIQIRKHIKDREGLLLLCLCNGIANQKYFHSSNLQEGLIEFKFNGLKIDKIKISSTEKKKW
jgi:hypothetical protein